MDFMAGSMHLILAAVGILLLMVGGECLIRGSLAAAQRLGVSPLLAGLLIVGFGTSAPELVVSLDAAFNERPDIALGNVVGSNIANVLLILGVCALIKPIAVQPLALRRDAVAVVAASVMFVLLAGGGVFVRADGAMLLAGMLAYSLWAYRTERTAVLSAQTATSTTEQEFVVLPGRVSGMALLVASGLLLLIGGSRLLLYGAIGLAETLEVSEALIGLTLVAVGTSLPELTISVLAAIRGHADVAIGNVLGSNIFNLLGILGVSALLQPLDVHQRVAQFDQWFLLGSAVLLFCILYTGRRLSRVEGLLLLFGFVVYLGLGFARFAV